MAIVLIMGTDVKKRKKGEKIDRSSARSRKTSLPYLGSSISLLLRHNGGEAPFCSALLRLQINEQTALVSARERAQPLR
jgi:hypothetical protein